MHESGLEIDGTPLPHSKLGMAAFGMSLLGILIFCLGFAIAFYIGAVGGGVVDQSSSTFQVAALLMCGSMTFTLIALGLGIGSLFQSQQKKTFGIISVVLSVLTLCAYGILTIIGLSRF